MLKQIPGFISVARRSLKTLIINRQKTFCPILWDGLFINQHGDIFTCCHEKPGKLGNIYQQDLKTVWEKSIFLKFYRATARMNCLYCFPDCTILSPELKQTAPPTPVFLSYPKKLWLLYGEACNIRCRMCWQNHSSSIRLNNDVLKKNIDWLQIDNIELQGGEILAMKDACELYLWLTQQMKRKVNIITNGLLLNDKWADYLLKGSKKITISVNAATGKTHELVNCGSNFLKVANNIEKLVVLKHRNGLAVEIWFKYTIVPENIQEIAAAIEVAKGLGCDSISYGYSSEIPAFFQQHEDIRQEMKNTLSRVIENNRIGIRIELGRLKQLGLF
jgi:MoaA/NifB/PqqE/SkfB family radical SAM enzyme